MSITTFPPATSNGGAVGDWGSIGGTLSNQADLQAALNSKASEIHFTDGSVDADFNTVNGRDVAVDGVKLDTIETNATADQTGAEIKIAYELEADTNAYTDIEKAKLADISVTQAVDLDVIETHTTDTANPHSVTKAQVGLASVDNTSDANKPVSTAQQTEIDTKQDTLINQANIKSINGDTLLGTGDLIITAGSGGFAAALYFSDVVSTIDGTYDTLSYTPDVGVTNPQITANNGETAGQVYLFELPIDTSVIDAGKWTANFYASVNSASGGSTTSIRYEGFMKEDVTVDALETETTLFTVTSQNLTTTPSYVEFETTQPVKTVSPTARYGIRLFAVTDANQDRIVTYVIGDGNASYTNTPLATRHSQLRARDEDDQHPINAITGLETTSTDNAVVRFDGTTGMTQNSLVTIDDSGNITVPGTVDGVDVAGLSTTVNTKAPQATTYTKTEVDTAISNATAALVDSSPETLDTLNELAAALGDDPDFATTTANTIGTKVAKVTSTDNAIVRFNGTTGEVQNSGVIVDDNGNVGVGITNPLAKHHVQGLGVTTDLSGKIPSTKSLIVSDELTNDNFNSLLQLTAVRQSLTTGSQSYGGIGFTTLDDSNSAGIIDAGRITFYNDNPASVTSGVGLDFWVNEGGLSTNTPEKAIRITPTKDVGFGTVTTPRINAQFNLAGGIETNNDGEIAYRYNMWNNGSDLFLQAQYKASSIVQNALGEFIFYSSSNTSAAANSAVSLVERMKIDGSGNVGIGTSTPSTGTVGSTRLVVGNDGVSGGTTSFTMQSQYGHMVAYHAGDNNYYQVVNTDGNYLIGFGGKDTSAFAEAIRIKNDGKVLVGTSTELPNATADHKLQVDGYHLHKYGWKDNVVQITPSLGDGTRWRDMGNGIFAMEFTTGDFVNVNYHINHDYAQGTNAYLHAHLLCADAQTAGSTITLEMGYVLAKGHSQGQSLTAPLTTFLMTYTYTGSEVAGEHIVLECSDAQAFDLIEPDTLLCVKLTLNSETVSGRIYILTMDLHYQSDREVTLNKAPLPTFNG